MSFKIKKPNLITILDSYVQHTTTCFFCGFLFNFLDDIIYCRFCSTRKKEERKVKERKKSEKKKKKVKERKKAKKRKKEKRKERK